MGTARGDPVGVQRQDKHTMLSTGDPGEVRPRDEWRLMLPESDARIADPG